MTTVAQAFNQGMNVWQENQDAPWGKLRYKMVLANLALHLTKPNQAILDVGGGNGIEGILLAQQGHHVTLVDFSSEMLKAARSTVDGLNLSSQVMLQQADVIDLPQLFGNEQFDVVLLHNVLQYVPDADAALRAIHAVLRADGFLSLGIINPYSEVLGPALRELDLVTALDNIGTKVKKQNIFGLTHPLYTLEELEQMLHRCGFRLQTFYGVRSLCDYIADNERKADPIFFAQLEQLEMALRDQYPFKLIARFWHLIAVKISPGQPEFEGLVSQSSGKV